MINRIKVQQQDLPFPPWLAMTAVTNITANTEQQSHKKQDKKKEKQLLENKGHANMQPYKRQCKERPKSHYVKVYNILFTPLRWQ